jgi:hypothetical protein
MSSSLKSRNINRENTVIIVFSNSQNLKLSVKVK